MEDKITIDRIKEAHPKLRDKMLQDYREANNLLGKGVRLRFAYVFRSNALQDKLYNQRPKITNAKGGQSIHNYGLAFDIVLLYDNDGNGTFEEASYSQIRDFDNDGVVDMSMYGPNIVEFKVENSGKFLVLDMNPDNNQAKKVWGQSHSLISQLKKIMGGKFLNFYNKNKELIDSFNEILVKTKVTTASGREEELKKDVQGRFLTAPIGLKLAEMPGFISLVDGMSFTGGNDGRVLVIYNANLAKPTRYTPDDGKTWIPMEKLEYQYDKVRGMLDRGLLGYNLKYNLYNLFESIFAIARFFLNQLALLL